MILAGDLGGTSTRLGLFDVSNGRPRTLAARTFTTLEFTGLAEMIASFVAAPDVRTTPPDAACFGVAGPVTGDAAQLTNVPWRVDARELETACGFRRVALLNDLQAMAYAVPVLQNHELLTLQAGHPVTGGNMALIAAGTGLGQALLHHVDGRFIPSPSEGGHADYAARTEADVAVLRHLTQRFGRAEVEHVVSGPGLLNLHRVTHTSPCLAVADVASPEAPAAITVAALEGRCPSCVETLHLFVDAYGAEAGNLAVRSVSTGGLFVGGGIAPKILPALTDGRFLDAFVSKGAMRDLLVRVPVHVILNADAGLLGAAVFGAQLGPIR